jgi:porphobilinogen deaminase
LKQRKDEAEMQTIDLRGPVRGKLKKLDEALHDTAIFNHDGLAGLRAYHAAKECIAAQTRVGFERRFAACRKACKQINVMVTPFTDQRAGQFVRIHIPTKNMEIILGA